MFVLISKMFSNYQCPRLKPVAMNPVNKKLNLNFDDIEVENDN